MSLSPHAVVEIRSQVTIYASITIDQRVQTVKRGEDERMRKKRKVE